MFFERDHVGQCDHDFVVHCYSNDPIIIKGPQSRTQKTRT